MRFLSLAALSLVAVPFFSGCDAVDDNVAATTANSDLVCSVAYVTAVADNATNDGLLVTWYNPQGTFPVELQFKKGSGSWTTVATGLDGTGGSHTYDDVNGEHIDPSPAANARFNAQYRVRQSCQNDLWGPAFGFYAK